MALHLLKMAVGIESFDHLRAVQRERLQLGKNLGAKGELRHLTRNKPKRTFSVLDGGSIYWIIKGYICARQKIKGFGEALGRNGRPRCAIFLDPNLIQTVLLQQKPIQGWRYLEEITAPDDLVGSPRQETSLPDEMAKELRFLGLL